MKSWQTKSGYQIIQLLSKRSNVFLIKNSLANLLVDTGPRFMRRRLLKRLDKYGIKKIDYLLLTHSHFDHANNAAFIKDMFGAQVIIHARESFNLETGTPVFPKGTNFVTKLIVNSLTLPAKYFMKTTPCVPDILVEDFFNLNELGFAGYILHTPGHTPGSVSLIVDDEIALVGDTMFGVFKESVFPPFANDVKQMIITWGKLIETNCHTFMPSHGTANSRKLVLKNYNKWNERCYK